MLVQETILKFNGGSVTNIETNMGFLDIVFKKYLAGFMLFTFVNKNISFFLIAGVTGFILEV